MPFFSPSPQISAGPPVISNTQVPSSLLSPDPSLTSLHPVSLQDLHHGRIQMKSLTNKWYEEVRQGPSGSEDDEQELF